MVDEPSGAGLRMTLCDVESPEYAHVHGRDEMWWFDFKDDLLSKKHDWTKVRAPFEDFYVSFGSGTRHNDRSMDLSKIVAFEINLISKAGEHPKGRIGVRAVRAYKAVP